MRLTFLVLILVGLVLPAAGQDVDEPVPVWGRFEHTFSADVAPTPPVQIAFTAPDGETQTVDGFWDGGSTWRVRFMPDQAGTWRYRTTSGADDLDGVEGQFESQPANEAESPFLRHGAVQVSSDGRYLTHADGTPFFWLGDTAWNGALLATLSDWKAYLAQRKAQQFSAIQFVATQWRTAYTNAEGETAYTVEDDSLRMNPAFFQRLDDYVDAVNEAGLLAAPVMLWALGDPEEMPVPGKLPTAHAAEIARYLVARYGAHHVLWFLGGDENYSGEERVEHWKEIGRSVFGDKEHAPVTLHPQGMQWHFEPFYDEPWLDVLIYQSGHGDDAETLRWIHSGPASEAWQQTSRPVINSEPPYEGHIAYQSGEPHTAYTVRRAVYWSLFNAPTAGVSYGGHGIWSWQTEPDVPLNHSNSGVAQPWHKAVNFEGGQDMQHVAELFTSLDWWTLRPDQDLLAEQPGGEDPARFVAAARASTGTPAVLYLPTGGSVTLSEDVEAEAFWFNPRDGSRTSATSEGERLFTAPDDQDWVLVFE